MLAPYGKFISVAAPDEPLPGFYALALNTSGAFIGGSHIGSKRDTLNMLALAAEKNVKPWCVPQLFSSTRNHMPD